MDTKSILSLLPFTSPYCFVDEIVHLNQEMIIGNYKFKEDESFYQGHFKNYPITPGMILTECCAQIGLVCHAIYLTKDKNDIIRPLPFVLTSVEMEFSTPVFPNEKVIVESKKIYFRFGKLKSKIKMTKPNGTLVCQGILAGMQTTSP